MKIAVMFVHGIGRPEPAFADGMMDLLNRKFRSDTGADDLVMRPAFWAPVLQDAENELWRRMAAGGPMDFVKLRRFMVDFAADAIAYQPAPKEKIVYEGVHRVLAATLKTLADQAGPQAPLVVVAHSLGTVIASNFFYDLQARSAPKKVPASVAKTMGKSPLDRGETLSLLFTLGSPIALWSLRYKDFGKPIQVPSPGFKGFYPKAVGGWTNFYDQDDVIGYPLRTINAAYSKAVNEDRAVNVGGLLSSWNPTSHTEYWTDRDVVNGVSSQLATLWRQVQS
ncbi:MAG: chemotaxis protein [Elusimicrobia bacterium]|nr:chemotaxis protein [Elusimicrobiota bacterium]MBP9699392.1 chemotaxis protein [Elusimicrobiota bacterium]